MFLTLHWLPIEKRITYKLATLCYKCKNGTAPSYLNDLISDHVPSRQLRSSSHCLFSVPPKKGLTKFSERSFKHGGPTVWNSLPLSLRLHYESSEATFKKHLKTYLFCCYIDEM